MKPSKQIIATSAVMLILIAASCGVSKKASTESTVKEEAGAPPKTWQEHWFEHDMLTKRVFYNDHVAVYYDKNMDTTVTWPFKTMSDTWAYVKKVYGEMGKDGRLYVILHRVVGDKFGGGHPASYLNESHDYRNMIDCGLGNWDKPTGEQIGMPIHEIGHIVTGNTHGVSGSPSDVLWGDSKFMEIFNYDVLMNIGRKDEAERVYTQMQTQYDDFPKAKTQWFKNWFYPIYSKYGKGALLNQYFLLVGQNFPKVNNVITRRKRMDMGEFVHFWSGAAGVNLKEQATLAFGWDEDMERKFRTAQRTFPNVKYKDQ